MSPPPPRGSPAGPPPSGLDLLPVFSLSPSSWLVGEPRLSKIPQVAPSLLSASGLWSFHLVTCRPLSGRRAAADKTWGVHCPTPMAPRRAERGEPLAEPKYTPSVKREDGTSGYKHSLSRSRQHDTREIHSCAAGLRVHTKLQKKLKGGMTSSLVAIPRGPRTPGSPGGEGRGCGRARGRAGVHLQWLFSPSTCSAQSHGRLPASSLHPPAAWRSPRTLQHELAGLNHIINY